MANLTKFNIELVAMTYQFFTGKVPSKSGFEWLIDSPENPKDINDPYYAGFNQENMYLNFANNLSGVSTSFVSKYGNLDYNSAVVKAYDEIIYHFLPVGTPGIEFI